MGSKLYVGGLPFAATEGRSPRYLPPTARSNPRA